MNSYGWLIVILAAMVGVLGTALLSLRFRVVRLERRLCALMAGSDDLDLEAALKEHMQRVEDVTFAVAQLAAHTRSLGGIVQSAVQHVGVVRYNPFLETGGDLSFAIALADGAGNGLLLNSLHARAGSRVYAKPLVGWHSRYPLSDEETEALNRARSGNKGNGGAPPATP